MLQPPILIRCGESAWREEYYYCHCWWCLLLVFASHNFSCSWIQVGSHVCSSLSLVLPSFSLALQWAVKGFFLFLATLWDLREADNWMQWWESLMCSRFNSIQSQLNQSPRSIIRNPIKCNSRRMVNMVWWVCRPKTLSPSLSQGDFWKYWWEWGKWPQTSLLMFSDTTDEIRLSGIPSLVFAAPCLTVDDDDGWRCMLSTT